MKQLDLLLLLFFFSISAGIAEENESKSNKKDTGPEIKFDKTIYDFGKIEYNGNGTCSFKFENTGKESLVLTRVRSECGTTITKWPKEPIKPGETAKIEMKYNTRIVGYFSKIIMVHSNATDSRITLRIRGQVGEKD